MRAILVAVDYADILSITLPYNRNHFDSIMVVTTPQDKKTIEVVKQNYAHVFATEAFYDDGAVFNKWKALEQGLDEFGREDWLCIMDADIMWPKEIPGYKLVKGNIYTPLRRMMNQIKTPIPSEKEWLKFPLHRQQVEWSGYTQIFHASDPVLPTPPWHQINWRHAGGADSFFQRLWPKQNKLRPPFEVLHLGPAGQNWCGRATEYIDGTKHPQSQERVKSVRNFIRSRKREKPNPFQNEQL